MSENSPTRILFSGPTVSIGEFRCPPGHSFWGQENISRGVLVVYPRVPVGISQAGRDAVLADANTVMFYNAGQPYRRRMVSPRGDECEFFVVDPAAAAEAVRAHDPGAAERPGAPFAFSHGPGDSGSYLRQRRVCDRARAGLADPLEVSETALGLLGAAVEAAWGLRAGPARRRPSTARAHADIAEAAKLVLSGRLSEPMSLEEVARAVHSSAYHLCRIFRRHTGVTMHRYREQLRLRSALERLGSGGCGLLRMALDLGYSSHSHFTDAFRREFGVTPSAFRESCRRSGAMSRNLGELRRRPAVGW
jgi:AraC family transcriptional regulator